MKRGIILLKTFTLTNNFYLYSLLYIFVLSLSIPVKCKIIFPFYQSILKDCTVYGRYGTDK